MSTLSLNGINNLGNAYARSIKLVNASGGWDDILALIGASGSGGVSDVQASSPLSVATSGAVRTVNINLGSCSITAQVQTLLNQKQNSLTAGSGKTLTGNTISFDSSLTSPQRK